MDQIVNFSAPLLIQVGDALMIKRVRNIGMSVDFLHVIDDVTTYLGVDLKTIKSKYRKREVVKYRALLIYALYRYTDLSFVRIGNLVGGRDHTTVIHNLSTIKNLLDTKDSVYYPLFYSYFTGRDLQFLKVTRPVTAKYNFDF